MKGKLSYPWKILPQTSYLHEINIDAVFLQQDIVIIRRSDLNEADTFNELGHVYEKAITNERVINLSMNMLGSYFQVDDSRFKVSGQGSNGWTGEKVFLKDYIHTLDEVEQWTPIYFNAKELNRIKIPLSLDAENDAVKKLAGALKRSRRDKSIKKLDFTGYSAIQHSPTNLNYWHVELGVFNEADERLNKTKNRIEQESADYLLKHVICVAGKKHISPSNIKKEYFKRNTSTP